MGTLGREDINISPTKLCTALQKAKQAQKSNNKTKQLQMQKPTTVNCRCVE